MLVMITSILLLSTCIILSIYSTLSAPWTTFTLGSLQFTNTIFQSVNTPESFPMADYSCIKSISCASEDSELCSISTRLEKAKKIYISFEAVSICILLMLLERLLLKALNRPYGSPNFFLVLIWLLPLTKTAGLLCFLLISGTQITQDSADGKIRAELGINLSIAAIGVSILAAILMILTKIHRSQRTLKTKIMNSTAKFLKILLMFSITFGLIILSKFYPTASFNGFSEITMNVHYVAHFDSHRDLSMACAKGIECRSSPLFCEIFSSLYSLEQVMFYLECTSYIFFFLWFESLMHLIARIRLGTNFCTFAYPVIYVVLNLTSLIYYFVSSKASYGAECNVEDFGGGWVLCAEMGITVYLISVIFAGLTMITFELIFAIFSVNSRFVNENKIGVAPDDLKKANVQDINVVEIDENNASDTSAETKSQNTNINTSPSIVSLDCATCKRPFLPSENAITENYNRYHYKCYVLSAK